MNIRDILAKKGYEECLGPVANIDYTLVEFGKKMAIMYNTSFEVMTTFADNEDVFIYTFFKDGFTVQRWIK
jgi:hypothetical protein